MKKEDLKYSQNFLKDSNFASSLLDKSNISEEDIVVEIGPGRGVITELLVKMAKRVIAIEYDSNLVKKLRERFENVSNVDILEEDFLKWTLPEFPYKVFSNIPFNQTADIVNKLLEAENPPISTYLIMQDKAAERFVGEPVGGNSQTSILLKPFYKMEVVAHIPRYQYTPTPKIDTMLVAFHKKTKPLIKEDEIQEYRDFIIYGFNQWKPTVLDSYKAIFSHKQIKNIKQGLDISSKKPTQLKIEDWDQLFKIYQQYVPENKKQEVRNYEKVFRNKHKELEKTHRTR